MFHRLEVIWMRDGNPAVHSSLFHPQMEMVPLMSSVWWRRSSGDVLAGMCSRAVAPSRADCERAKNCRTWRVKATFWLKTSTIGLIWARLCHVLTFTCSAHSVTNWSQTVPLRNSATFSLKGDAKAEQPGRNLTRTGTIPVSLR